MKWWPLYGLRRKFTEKAEYKSPVKVQTIHNRLFKRSLFVYTIDIGSSNAINFEIAALEAPQYNTHRFGIYFTDSPRHADVLLILGAPTKQMLNPLQEAISQLPEPFGIIVVDDSVDISHNAGYPKLPNLKAIVKGIPSPSAILGLLLNLKKSKTN